MGSQYEDIPRDRAGYEQIRDLCQFGTNPVEDKVVVTPAGMGYSQSQYRIVDNPIDLPTDLIALFCDSGRLNFGYHMNGPECICIHSD